MTGLGEFSMVMCMSMLMCFGGTELLRYAAAATAEQAPRLANVYTSADMLL